MIEESVLAALQALGQLLGVVFEVGEDLGPGLVEEGWERVLHSSIVWDMLGSVQSKIFVLWRTLLLRGLACLPCPWTSRRVQREPTAYGERERDQLATEVASPREV